MQTAGDRTAKINALYSKLKAQKLPKLDVDELLKSFTINPNILKNNDGNDLAEFKNSLRKIQDKLLKNK